MANCSNWLQDRTNFHRSLSRKYQPRPTMIKVTPSAAQLHWFSMIYIFCWYMPSWLVQLIAKPYQNFKQWYAPIAEVICSICFVFYNPLFHFPNITTRAPETEECIRRSGSLCHLFHYSPAMHPLGSQPRIYYIIDIVFSTSFMREMIWVISLHAARYYDHFSITRHKDHLAR